MKPRHEGGEVDTLCIPLIWCSFQKLFPTLREKRIGTGGKGTEAESDRKKTKINHELADFPTLQRQLPGATV